jgi:hypothetical protein
MAARRKLRRSIGFGIVSWLGFASCTLTSDPYDPLEASAPLQPGAAGASALGDAGAPPPASDPSPSPAAPPCTSANEVAGCEVELLPGACSTDADCESRNCRDGSCLPATCTDTRLNQNESAPDCGGDCQACAAGASCRDGDDCSSGVCGDDATCAEPRCDDGVTNGNEPFTDCGNAECGPCPDGSACSDDAQCANERCRAGICRPRLCADGERNGTETDTDCGGGNAGCARCVAGDSCAVGSDCVSRSCVNGSCSSCGDGERNGTETGVDCGGSCGPCAPGGGCQIDADCQSAACEDGRCCGGTRVDCTRCARRLAQTLNCNSNGANGAAQCEAFLDCLADNANSCPVRYEPGCTDDPGGVCNHTNFGGNTGPGVLLADAILGTAACTFGDE